MERIRILATADKYADSLQLCLDVVARERRYLAFTEAPPVDAVRGFVQFLIGGAGVQSLAVDEADTVVGWCDIIRNPREGFRHCGQLGMGLVPAFRHRGLGRDLATTTIARARGVDIKRIELEVFSSNDRAVALYRTLGFVLEGTKRQARDLDGLVDDILIMASLEESLSGAHGISPMPSNER